MTYIILAAGKGSRLQPLTLARPKSLYKLDQNTTVLQRMVRLLERHDPAGKVVVVVGYMEEKIRAELASCAVEFVYNPFYAVTNSIASLWFAREYLQTGDNLTVVNADIVMENSLVRDILCKRAERPCVLLDSSIKSDGDYNVRVNRDRVVVMSKNLDGYDGEYAGVTKLDHASAVALYQEIDHMIRLGAYDQWYENALVQMIFDEDFALYYTDICNYQWTEVDCVSDMLLAKKIHE